MKILNLLLITAIFLAGYYLVVYRVFASTSTSKDLPQFRARLGTILYHTDTPGTAYHTYCYYPTSHINFDHRGSEYILKRVNTYKDCQGWLGIAIYKEGWWVSEREKLWWDGDYFNDRIANSPDSSKSI